MRLVELPANQQTVFLRLPIIVGHRDKENLVNVPRVVGPSQRKKVLQIDPVVLGDQNEVLRLIITRRSTDARDKLRTRRKQGDESAIRRRGRYPDEYEWQR